MAISPPYIRLSNGDIITFERLGPFKTAILSNSEGVLIKKGNKLIGITEKQLANTIILEFPDPKPTIIEEVLSPLPTIPLPLSQVQSTPTPQKVEEKRLQEAANNQLILDQQAEGNIDVSQIENATPDDLKAIGIAKLPLILLTIGNQVKKIIEPAIKNLITTYIQKYLTSGICADQATIDKIIQQRNLIVSQLNKIGKTLNIITLSLTGVSAFLNLVTNNIKTIKNIALGLSATAKLVPSPPGLPGIIASGLNDAQTFIRETTFDDKGNSKLTKLNSIIGGAALVASIIGGYILIVVTLLNSIDAFLKKCSSASSQPVIPISSEILAVAEIQLKSNITQNETTYNGFIIEIEVVPYTPTVNRRRALGKNQYGIVLIQTELSFTTNNQTLISELKFIIDRDNLKAY